MEADDREMLDSAALSQADLTHMLPTTHLCNPQAS